ncbi:cytochrome P450 6B5-like [Cydia pomonella]|uniref:cytochrome P450 6B5-like n=1 Tax=Cydia pomonella TaxID=82600 RepID=UPI002ADD484B|nr:cytochrome P450 6B5-like [Cydia pomonella]
MALIESVAFAVVIGALYFYFTRTFNYWKARNVQGPKPVPFFGNIFESALRYVHPGIITKRVYDSYPTEKVVGMFRMTTPCLLIRDLDIVKHVLIKDFDSFVDRGIEFSDEGLGTNLFHANGETWRKLRSRFTPMFTNQKLKNMMHLINDRADKFIDYISEITLKNPEQDIYPLVKKYTMSTMAACFFGLDIDTLRGDTQTVMRIDKAIFTPTFAIEFDMMYPGLLKKMNMSLFPKDIKKFFKNLVETIMTQRNGVPSTRKDFMDLILEYKNKNALATINSDAKVEELTNGEIEAQAFAFYAAGYDTSASTLCFMLYQLALEPEIQDRLRNEIDTYLHRHGDQIELDTLNELPYLDQVLNETLRMYPIDDTLLRKAQHHYKFPGTNVEVSQGQILLIPALGIHHDEKYYPKPEIFNPENFARENVTGRHPCSFLPFGLGPRNCIGIRFAQTQIRVCAIRLLSKFRIEVSKNTVRSFCFDPYRINIAPNKKLYVNFCPRMNL